MILKTTFIVSFCTKQHSTEMSWYDLSIYILRDELLKIYSLYRLLISTKRYDLENHNSSSLKPQSRYRLLFLLSSSAQNSTQPSIKSCRSKRLETSSPSSDCRPSLAAATRACRRCVSRATQTPPPWVWAWTESSLSVLPLPKPKVCNSEVIT